METDSAISQNAAGEVVSTRFEEALKLQGEYLQSVKILNGEARALRIKPVLNILFNLVEMDFVTNQWADCLGRIEGLLPDMDPSDLTMIRLLEFKYLLCKLKLGKIEEARTLSKKYDFRDDYPYYYYANAAMAYHDENEAEAEMPPGKWDMLNWIERLERLEKAKGGGEAKGGE